MTVFVLIADGDYTEQINGESVTARMVELIAAYTNPDEALAAMRSGRVDVAEPEKWGVRAINMQSVEVEEC
jgi:hypothetical protein